MKKAEIRKPFLEMIESIVLPKGFLKQKNSEGFEYVKKRDNGYICVNPMIWQYDTLFFISLGFSCRINEISQILVHINNIGDEYKNEYPTVSFNIKSLIEIDDERIRVETESELQSGLIFLRNILEKEGLQFFENFQTIADFDKDFNRENRPLDLYANQELIGLISAVLNHNPKVMYWEDFYRKMISNMNNHTKQQYEKLVDYLKNNY